MIPVLNMSFIRVGLYVRMKRAASAGTAHTDLPFSPQVLYRFSVVAFHWQESSARPQNLGVSSCFLLCWEGGREGSGKSWPFVFLPKCCPLCRGKRAISRAIRKEDKKCWYELHGKLCFIQRSRNMPDHVNLPVGDQGNETSRAFLRSECESFGIHKSSCFTVFYIRSIAAHYHRWKGAGGFIGILGQHYPSVQWRDVLLSPNSVRTACLLLRQNTDLNFSSSLHMHPATGNVDSISWYFIYATGRGRA